MKLGVVGLPNVGKSTLFNAITHAGAECANYPFCGYTINDLKAVVTNNRCPECGDFLVIRNGSNGRFIGCHNYPRCRHTRQLK